MHFISGKQSSDQKENQKIAFMLYEIANSNRSHSNVIIHIIFLAHIN